MGTVPLLLIELILVMKLPADETSKLSWNLGIASAVMVALGYPGEIQNDLSTRWFWWACAMLFFRICRLFARGWPQRSYREATRISKRIGFKGPLPHRLFMVDLPFRLHHQERRDCRANCNDV